MPSLAELLGQGVKAGLNDDSFSLGYKTEADVQAKKLKDMLALKQAQAAQEMLRSDPGLQSAHVGESSVSRKDGSAGLAALLSKNQEREDRAAERLTQRSQQIGLPGAVQQLQNLETTTAGPHGKGILTDSKYKVKTAGPVANVMPEWALNVGERIGLMPKGAQDERQAAQALINVDTRKFAGANQTAHEMGRKLVEQGRGAGGNPEDFRKGLQMMQSAIQAEAANLEAGFQPKVVQRVKEAGAVMNPRDVGLGPEAGMAPKKKMSFEEWKRQKNARKGN